MAIKELHMKAAFANCLAVLATLALVSLSVPSSASGATRVPARNRAPSRAHVSCEGSLVSAATDNNQPLPWKKFDLRIGKHGARPQLPQELGVLGSTSFRVRLSGEGAVPVLEIEAVSPAGVTVAGSPLDHLPTTVAYRSTTASGDDLLVECSVGNAG